MESIGKLNAAIYRNLQSIMNLKIGDIQVQSGQLDFLYVVAEYEGITQQEISQMLYVDKSTTAKCVKSLMEKGYVRIERSERDRRCHQLYLTDKGKELKPRLEKLFAENIALTSKPLSESEADQLTNHLKRVLMGLIEEKKRLIEEEKG